MLGFFLKMTKPAPFHVMPSLILSNIDCNNSCSRYSWKETRVHCDLSTEACLHTCPDYQDSWLIRCEIDFWRRRKVLTSLIFRSAILEPIQLLPSPTADFHQIRHNITVSSDNVTCLVQTNWELQPINLLLWFICCQDCTWILLYFRLTIRRDLDEDRGHRLISMKCNRTLV